jgi:hypothetical protein
MNDYPTSKINFPATITSLASRMIKKHGLHSVKFLESDDTLTFTVNAHKYEYDSAIRIVKKAEIRAKYL